MALALEVYMQISESQGHTRTETYTVSFQSFIYLSE